MHLKNIKGFQYFFFPTGLIGKNILVMESQMNVTYVSIYVYVCIYIYRQVLNG